MPSTVPQAQPTWTHRPALQHLVSLSVYLKFAVFLFDHSENSQPIRREAQNISDWLTTLRWFLVLKATNKSSY